MKQLPHHIIDWLTSRTISLDVINQAGIDYSEGRIVIPVLNSRGEFKFNKYRKDPGDLSPGPKYSYEAGGKTSLYGVETLSGSINHMVICEGELDALALRSQGFTAISSTGGCGSFRTEWGPKLLEYKVPIYICYDHDEPGMQGAVNVAAQIPGSLLIWLPDSVGEKGDVTDFLKSGGDFQELIDNATPMPNLSPPELGCKKIAIKRMRQSLSLEVSELVKVARELRSRYKDDRHIQIIIKKVVDHISKLSILLRRRSERQIVAQQCGGDSLARAKTVSIKNFIEFNHNYCAKCIWHKEKTPSMRYYPQSNRVKCYGCGRSGDVVDVVQQLKSLSISEAIKLLTT